ncbi:NADH-quinone oxidoreductase subunit NuoE [Pelagibacteraceae bacterium]|nr:NADH-quinone oxidoreductase subunit NuoE [Pelagibacteraceae bacterium]
MSLKKIHDVQPESFEFSKANLDVANGILKKYPSNRKKSAVMPLLYLAQKQNENWIPLAAMKHIAKYLEIPYIKVYEVATFYTMYNLAPVGKYFVQVCTTSPCLIRGANKIVKICKEKISKEENKLSKNKLCSWLEVECLGACVNGPMMQINNDYYEDLDEKNTIEIINSLLEDKPIKYRSFRNRTNTAPEKNRQITNVEKNA